MQSFKQQASQSPCDQGKSSPMALERLASLMGSGKAVGLCPGPGLCPRSWGCLLGPTRRHDVTAADPVLPSSPPTPARHLPRPSHVSLLLLPRVGQAPPTPGLHSRTFLPLTPGSLRLSQALPLCLNVPHRTVGPVLGCPRALHLSSAVPWHRAAALSEPVLNPCPTWVAAFPARAGGRACQGLGSLAEGEGVEKKGSRAGWQGGREKKHEWKENKRN